MITKFLAIIFFVFFSPFYIIIGISIILFDGRPIFFKQKRIGINNKIIYILKFRTMKINTRDIPTHLVNNPQELVTKTGSFIRKTSLDELPQIINIIKGDMTFVGPRPALYNQDDLIRLREKSNIHKLKPGVTGWAQVNGRDKLSIEEKVRFEEYYYKNKSLFFDIKIILITIIQIFYSNNKGISH